MKSSFSSFKHPRFRRTDLCLTEWVELYRPGGYHPVVVGDEFQEGRYRVIRKLGAGRRSTVWMAVCGAGRIGGAPAHQSREPHPYVALKCLASSAAHAPELEMLTALASPSPHGSADGQRYMLPLLESFTSASPNGTHTILVLPLLAADATTLPPQLPCYRAQTYDEMRRGVNRARFGTGRAKRVLKQVLGGLAFLHARGVVHAGLRMRAVGFLAGERLAGVEERRVTQRRARTERVRRVDGRKVDRNAPRYVAAAMGMEAFADVDVERGIRIGDLGSAFYASSPPEILATKPESHHFRAPEVILPLGSSSSSSTPLTPALDIWAFGCLIYELLTGLPLFPVADFTEQEDVDVEHLIALNDTIAPLPARWDALLFPLTAEARESAPYKKRQRVMQRDGEGGWIQTGVSAIGKLRMERRDTLKALWKRERPVDVDAKEAAEIFKVLRGVLRFDAKKRPTAGELLEEQWFKDIVV
ncbi:uncharacterized protein L3040_007672 [Drepanopeziza brunnea f. sp. 'multigermtubi']|uniref:non-specific serine/threonine protein kinase n=1 Tax=Marssonina brunnea f. sp. multigermtubi (strain MB_m1) TaxID=1072389 RepID=K1WYY0_MARBU|nr:serine protein kinase [Drepanopeziza brunnea f. sp. 'multigermtubi' MB_m1]EKD18151.1 serine protein kinase [Drepanopeziza brunnea f. sp. 'multigermtubi' MB_m1]KAJ5037498.1 hypothetical protein L3040_007672 [Drepanopeziza brunnea f. sp. 'multigermtubi']